jgi:Arc/MetJ family transcription regulator
VYVEVYDMRTNIVLNDELLKKAFKVTKAKTKKELVHEALEELIAVRQKRNLRDLKGKIAFREDYDHKALRKGARSGTR